MDDFATNELLPTGPPWSEVRPWSKGHRIFVAESGLRDEMSAASDKPPDNLVEQQYRLDRDSAFGILKSLVDRLERVEAD